MAARPRVGAGLVVATVLVAVAAVLLAGRLVGGDDVAHADGGHGSGHHRGGPDTAEVTDPVCEPGTPTAAETSYVAHMVDHHRQAVRMAVLLRRVDGVPYRVQNLADHIAAVQRGEVGDMRAWLTAWQQASVPAGCVADAGHHAHATTGDHEAAMPGMVSEQALAELTTLRGEAAGRRYVELMIEHHRGAVSMSEPVAQVGGNPWVLSLARHVVADQQVEIGAMQRILQSS